MQLQYVGVTISTNWMGVEGPKVIIFLQSKVVIAFASRVFLTEHAFLTRVSKWLPDSAKVTSKLANISNRFAVLD